MVNPILPNPDETDQAMVMEFEKFVQSHWFFNGREKGDKIVHRGMKPTFTVFDEGQRGENLD